jgi:mediator of replication checkpoint protein 1
VNPRRRPADETSKRAKTLAEIREAVSFLIDEPLVPDSQVSGSEAGSDYEDEDEDEASDDGKDRIENVITTTRVRRQTTILRTVRPSIINRLSMTRTHSEDDIASGPLAFHAPIAGSTSGGFKVPSLLRRATTNLSTTSNTSSGTTTPSAGGAESGIRRGGSKKSNIHYQAREAERKKVVDASERRRKEEVKKTVLGTGRQSILGSFGVGKHSGFE